MVSSSSPSSPRNTQASTPRRAKTPAITGAIRRSAQPIACACGPGRVGDRAEEVEASCPRRARGGRTAACRSAGWKAAAKQNVMPGLVRHPGDVGRPAGRAGCRAASSTSALPGLRRGGPVAVLDHGDAGAGGDDRGHRGDVHRERPVAAGADDVEHPARRPAAGWRARTSPRPGPRPPRRSRPWRAARRRSRRSAPGVASPARISPIAQAVWSLSRSSPLISDPRTSGQVVAISCGHQGVWAGTRERSSRITVSASSIGSSGCETAASARDQVASQLSWTRPVSTSTGGQR